MNSPLRLKSTCCPAAVRVLLCLFALILLVGAQSASAQNSGNIFTTFLNGTTVNGNIYPSKDAVYLNGGPQNENSNGLPTGSYYFQVTNPNGDTLLSTDDITCRQVVVGLGTSGKGVFQGHPSGSAPLSCTNSDGGSGNWHANGGVNASNGGSIPVQLCAVSGCPAGSPDFKDTTNTGGEYKVWLTLQDDYTACAASKTPSAKNNFCFVNSNVKTDNFKVQTGSALVTVCKFNDFNDNGIQDNGESLIPHWPITATGVDPTSGNPTATGTTVSAQTGDNGCIAFSYSGGVFPHTITLTEGPVTGWTQTAPADGTYDAGGNPAGSGPTSVAGFVETITVKSGDSITAPNFGNNNCGGDCSVKTLVVTKTANPSLTRTFTWAITKSVDNTEIDTSGSATFNYTVSVTHDSGTDSNWQVTGSIRVGNPGGSDVTGVIVTDAVDNNGSCTVDSSGFNGTVPANSHVDLPYTCTYSSAPTPGTGTNTATATSPDGQFTGTAPFDFGAADVTLVDDSVTVTDSLGGTLGTVFSTDPSPKTFTYSKTFTDTAGTCTTHNNTATFTTDTNGTTGSDSKSVKVCVGADLTVSKTLTATYTSVVTKTGSEAAVTGGTKLNYTVTETATWTLSGSITVSNPNDWESIAFSVSDPLCSFTASGTLAPNGTQTFTYSCAAAAQSGTNTATVTWNAAAAFTPDGSASSSASFSFPTLTITDTFTPPGGTPVTQTLGTISAPTLSQTYNLSFGPFNPSLAPGTCTANFTNVASVTATGGNATATNFVSPATFNQQICTVKGGLTIGFWSNKNGQNLIIGAGPSSGTCSLTLYLRQYIPFQDLSPTAPCGTNQSSSKFTSVNTSTVTQYVESVIQFANASGSSMNAMLKAQMLATALNVSGIPGTTLSAGTKINLKSVCLVVDSGGTGTCGGTYQDDSFAFGGAASMPIGGAPLSFANLLSWAGNSTGACSAGTANATVGGSSWYCQNKTVQGQAKNVFDAINNNIAFVIP